MTNRKSAPKSASRRAQSVKPGFDFVSDAIVGPFKAKFRHSHAKDIGPARQMHTHDVDVKLTFRADNAEGVSFVLNKGTQRTLEGILQRFFNRDFTGATLEATAQALFKRIHRATPRLRDQFNQRAFHLHEVSLAIQYDGSLDHPTQRIEFVTALA